MQKLCNKINMNQAETINSFILGLPVAVRGTVAALNPQTFSEAYNHVCKLRASLPNQASAPQVAALQTAPAGDNKLDAISSQLNGIISRLSKLEVTQSVSQGPLVL